MHRNKSYDEELSEDLKDPQFRQEFILSLMEGEDGLSAEEALKHTIERMGVKEFSKLSKIPAPNIVDFIKGRRNPKPETLKNYLKPFRLKAKITFEKAS
jgi:predicted transcriptional regulator